MNMFDAVDRRNPDRPGPTPTTILVVDDSAAMRKILKKVLQHANLRVIEAADGQEALAYCMIDRPALILLDVDMPTMDGIATLNALKQNPDLRDIPVLMLTARTSGSDVADALTQGAQDYLRKPCEPAEMLARIRTALTLQEKQKVLFKRAEELGEISATDALTEIGNRRFLAQRLAALTRSLGGQAEVAVLLIDIDHFKAINDAHGHLVGDAVLSELAQRLNSLIDPAHILVRWGGEEFLIVIPEPVEGEPVQVAEEARVAVAGTPFGQGNFGSLDVAVSVGVARGTLESLTAVLRRADSALYSAKRAGRNRVMFAQ